MEVDSKEFEKIGVENELSFRLFDLSSRLEGSLLILDSVGNDLETLKSFVNVSGLLVKEEKEKYIKEMICATEKIKQTYDSVIDIMKNIDAVMEDADIAEA